MDFIHTAKTLLKILVTENEIKESSNLNGSGTSREMLISGAPKRLFCDACAVRHRI
jgi:hypothetical protein